MSKRIETNKRNRKIEVGQVESQDGKGAGIEVADYSNSMVNQE
ncbi:23735_t:CDS:2 [Entrophospora sp. SA101]|nr:23735_t:CDS:2 [Entrophospora sp. SA101]CAJ0857736.1 13759_t:CDS:2 [Entrophospora sp. SA101]